ncbi:MAG: PQQ-binding-like beta-propeller repeat protein, partial [Bacteroidales bacterium]
FSLFACEKDDNDNPDNDTEEIELDIVWKNVVFKDSASAGYFTPQFTGDYVVFGSTGGDYSDPGFAVYHKETGERHQAWNHEPDFDFIDKWKHISDFEIAGKNRNALILFIEDKIVSWDLNTGNILWEKALDDDYLHYSSSYGKYIFLTRTPSGTDDWAELIALDAKSGDEKVILHESFPANGEVKIFLPSATTLPNGDTLLVFSKVDYAVTKSYVYAFNMTADSLVWETENVQGSLPANEGIIADGYYVFQGYRNISCLDIQTGKLLWSDEPYGEITNRKLLYAEGKVFLNSNEGAVYCYDVGTGNKLWTNKKYNFYPSMNSQMRYYQGKLYLTAGYNFYYPEKYRHTLRCLSGNTGEVLWTSSGPEEARLGEGLNIDQNTGYLYITNRISAFCIDLNHDPLADS